MAPDPATGWPPEGESAVAAGAKNATLLVVAPTARIVDDAIVARMTVTNPTDRVVSVVVYPLGGSFPYGGDSPFTLRFGPSAPVTYAGELFPPGPPAPMRIDFPPTTQVTFEATIALERWTWSGNPTVPLDWGFHFVSGASPGGHLAIPLPLRYGP